MTEQKTTINGYTLDHRVKQLNGELQAWATTPSRVEEILRHHLGVCYEMFEQQQARIEELEEKLEATKDAVNMVCDLAGLGTRKIQEPTNG